jgi:altronate dehydratase small subunit
VTLGDGDNVVVAIRALAAGERVPLADGRTITLATAIPFGHKLAVLPIEAGGDVVKYDEVIGRATDAIGAGEHVHTHNVVSARLPGDLPAYHGGAR